MKSRYFVPLLLVVISTSALDASEMSHSEAEGRTNRPLSLAEFREYAATLSHADFIAEMMDQHGIEFPPYADLQRKERMDTSWWGRVARKYGPKLSGVTDIIHEIVHEEHGLVIAAVVRSHDYRYLVFRKAGDAHRYVDMIRQPLQGEIPPRDRLFEMGDSLLFSVIGGGTGTGLKMIDRFFHEIREGSVAKVFQLPWGGHVFGWGMAFNRSYQVTLERELEGADTLEFSVGASYSFSVDHHTEIPLFSVDGSLRIVWKNGTFVTADSSELTMETVNDFAHQDEAGFVKTYRDRLVAMARSDDEVRAAWASKLLEKHGIALPW